jgi:hypothetical protein
VPTHIVVFLAAALLVNLVTYGGMTWVYLADKHRVDPPKPEGHAMPVARQDRPAHRELSEAA